MAALNEEQTLIRDQAQSWAGKECPVAEFRKMRDEGVANGFRPTTYAQMVEMGWTGILVPEEYGGSDLGFMTFGLILEELGKELVASPLFASALVGASGLNLGGSDAQKSEYLPQIVDGSAIFTLAVDEGARHDPAGTALAATASGNGYTLNGTKTAVLEGAAATHFIVAARTSGDAGDARGISLFIVPADAPGVSRRELAVMDSRGYARVEFSGVEVGGDAVLGNVDDGFDLLDAILDRGRAGLGAEMMGVAVHSFDMTLEYLKTRKQFGAVIGSFQALGHRAAALYSAIELSRSCAEAALQAIDADDANISEMASLSMARVGDMLHEMSNQLIQIHGGIGMTDEFDAGLYLKRARGLAPIFGNAAFHRERYARLLGY